MRGIVFVVLFAPLSIAFFVGAALAEALRPGAVFAVRAAWGRAFLWLARAILGVRLTVVGAVPERGLVAAKHQSLFETIALAAVLPRAAVVLKRELLGLPLWRFLVRRARAIPVDRAASATALRAMLTWGRAADHDGHPILIFPEGTRVAPGDAPALLPGVAGLYRALGLPVVPVALDSGLLWPARGFGARAGTVTFAFGPAIAPGLPRAELERRLHAAINHAP